MSIKASIALDRLRCSTSLKWQPRYESKLVGQVKHPAEHQIGDNSWAASTAVQWRLQLLPSVCSRALVNQSFDGHEAFEAGQSSFTAHRIVKRTLQDPNWLMKIELIVMICEADVKATGRLPDDSAPAGHDL